MKRFLRATALTVAIGFSLIFPPGALQAQQVPFTFDLVPASAAIASCLPNAHAKVTVFPREEILGVDTLDLKAEGLPPNTAFAVFLTEKPTPRFGAVQYIGDFTTNAAGQGSMRVDAIIVEAFALASSDAAFGDRLPRVELNHVVAWFADPAGDDVCFGTGGGPITPFDGDGEAGAAALSSQNSLPGAPLP